MVSLAASNRWLGHKVLTVRFVHSLHTKAQPEIYQVDVSVTRPKETSTMQKQKYV